MRLAIITQEDAFVIPRNIERILRLRGVETALIVVLDAKGSVVNRKRNFAKGFGFVQAALMGARYGWARISDCADALFGYSLLKDKRSVKAVARKNKIAFLVLDNPNEKSFLERIKNLKLDLIISYSAPCVFQPALLESPALGCINLHCSYLPSYAGLLPSFWVLFHGESETGATVHYMDSKIDNGRILGQVRVPIEPGISMFDLIEKTKAAGGDLMANIVRRLAAGEKIETRPNEARKERCFTWPTVAQMKEFRRRGGRFV